MFKDLKLHYHDNGHQPQWQDIPPGTWVKDGVYWARRAFDTHIYDIVVNIRGQIYFWKDFGGWYLEGTTHPDVEQAKALATVLLRLKESQNEQ